MSSIPTPQRPLSGHTERLSAAEEVELAKQIEAGLYAEHLLATGDTRYDTTLLKICAREGRTAFERFVAANQRLAAWWARRRVAAGGARTVSVEDLTSEGVVGLVRGVCKFDYTLGYKFSTYASWWVRHFQQRAVIAAAATKVSHADEERIREVLGAEQDLRNALRRTPTDREIAEHLGATVKSVQQVRDMMRGAVSLDQPAFGPESPTYAEAFADESLPADEWDVDLNDLLAALPRRERALVSAAFGLAGQPARSVSDLARAHRLSVPAVEAVLDNALALMRGAASATLAPAA
jgi:RNA polymerase sigma factor (sigma-70 family)